MHTILHNHWIYKSIHTFLKTNTLTTPSLLQLITPTLLSDSTHYIKYTLNKNSLSKFHTNYNLKLNDIIGCFLTIKKYEILFKEKFIFLIHEFEYEGNECNIVGNPVDVNLMGVVKQYVSFSLEEYEYEMVCYGERNEMVVYNPFLVRRIKEYFDFLLRDTSCIVQLDDDYYYVIESSSEEGINRNKCEEGINECEEGILKERFNEQLHKNKSEQEILKADRKEGILKEEQLLKNEQDNEQLLKGEQIVQNKSEEGILKERFKEQILKEEQLLKEQEILEKRFNEQLLKNKSEQQILNNQQSLNDSILNHSFNSLLNHTLNNSLLNNPKPYPFYIPIPIKNIQSYNYTIIMHNNDLLKSNKESENKFMFLKKKMNVCLRRKKRRGDVVGVVFRDYRREEW